MPVAGTSFKHLPFVLRILPVTRAGRSYGSSVGGGLGIGTPLSTLGSVEEVAPRLFQLSDPEALGVLPQVVLYLIDDLHYRKGGEFVCPPLDYTLSLEVHLQPMGRVLRLPYVADVSFVVQEDVDADHPTIIR